MNNQTLFGPPCVWCVEGSDRTQWLDIGRRRFGRGHHQSWWAETGVMTSVRVPASAACTTNMAAMLTHSTEVQLHVRPLYPQRLPSFDENCSVFAENIWNLIRITVFEQILGAAVARAVLQLNQGQDRGHEFWRVYLVMLWMREINKWHYACCDINITQTVDDDEWSEGKPVKTDVNAVYPHNIQI